MENGYTFGAHLRQLRRASGLTQEGLAQRVPCSVELIRKVEHATRRPSAHVAARLADILGILPAARGRAGNVLDPEGPAGHSGGHG